MICSDFCFALTFVFLICLICDDHHSNLVRVVSQGETENIEVVEFDTSISASQGETENIEVVESDLRDFSTGSISSSCLSCRSALSTHSTSCGIVLSRPPASTGMPYGVTSPPRAGRPVDMTELLRAANVPLCTRQPGCATCEEYVLAIDLLFWDQSTMFLYVGTFHSHLSIHDLLRNLRYFFPGVPLRITFSV